MSSPPMQPAASLIDLAECANEPIQFAGAVEPHGLMLVLGTPALCIVQASANTLPYIDIAPEAVLGMRLGDIVSQQDADRLTAGAFNPGKRRYVGRISLLSNQRLFDALVHKQQDLLIVELEPHSPNAGIRHDFEVYALLTDAMSELDGPAGLADFSQRVATRIRQVTGFDRVMVYRFLEDDSGSVIAEDRRADLAPYLGLRYPASDIPAQARRLYLLNTLRLKPDVNAQRVAVIPPLNPLTGAALDMSFSILRAMSPVHDEYLRNMGVASSLSISIIKEDRLWGLIACHHSSAKLVPHPIRIACEVLAHVFSSGIAAAEHQDNRFRAEAVRDLTQSINARLRKDRNISGTLNGEADYIKSAMRAHGVAFYLQGKLSLVGLTPASQQVHLLIAWLFRHQQEHILASQRLAAEQPEIGAAGIDADGILSLRIALDGPDFIVWFRPAIVKVIKWAGNPEKPAEALAPGQRIGPRRSFAMWQQTVADSSEAWDQIDRQFAQSFRHVIAEALLLQLNEEAQRLNAELSRSNRELDAFATAAGHDLQEPLRLIRNYAQLIVRGAGRDFSPQTRQFLAVIEGNAGRMGDLIASLLNYAEVGGTERRERAPVSTEDALRDALLNLQALMRESGAAVTHDALPVINADHDHLLQVLQNLVGNALKYRRMDKPACIHLSATPQGDLWCFSIRDNGQGFAPEYSQAIFKPFKRLHGREVPGSGIGLATCKRIVELYGGRIWAESEGSDSGATFWFTMPAATPEHSAAKHREPH